MIVLDIFHLQSGYTVFVGPIEGCSMPIKQCSAELLLDGKVIQTLTVSGEFLMNVKHPQGHRAISTTDCVDLTSSSVREHQYSLRLISQPF
jgi:hypothetical protein